MSRPPIKIVLAALDSQYVHSALAPWCLRAGLLRYCGAPFSVVVTEGNVNEPIEGFAGRIIAEAPALVGFSCYIWNVEQVVCAARAVRAALPDCRIAFGGPEVGYRAGSFLDETPCCDFVLSGEGELPFAKLAEALYSGGELSSVPGLCFRTEKGVAAAAPYITKEEPPSPYCPEYFAALGGRFAYLETSRGCPFHCAFCLSGREGGARSFPIERAKAELLALAKSGARAVKLVDRTFNADRARARELFSFISENYGGAIPTGTRFHFEIGGDLLDRETLALLAGAPKGSMQLEIGLQSFNSRTLAAVCRAADTGRLAENIAAVLAPGNIHVHIDLIAGLPHEDRASFAESFRRAFRLRPHMLQLGFLKLLYGAPMREEPEKYPCKFSPAPPYEVISTPWLTSDELDRLRRADDALGRLYNSGRFRRTVEYAAGTGVEPLAFFMGLGELLPAGQSLSLDEFTALAFQYISALPGVEKERLRDLMALDRLATNPSGGLPVALKIPDRRLRQARVALERSPGTKRPDGIRRGLVWLYTEGRAAYADYTSPDPITGEYEIKFWPETGD